MQDGRKKVLMVEDEPAVAKIMKEVLENPGTAGEAGFAVEHATGLRASLERIKKGNFDIVLLDLSLPDSHGYATFKEVHHAAPDLPVVIMTGLADESIAMKAVQEGAQDYLMKGHIDVRSIVRSLHYAIERSQQQEKLKALSFVDELTGVYNRRGFMKLIEQQILLANRTKKGLCLMFIDLDGLKSINDQHGHKIGDMALQETADILRTTFRRSDVVARMGGDEFVILMIEGLDASDVIIKGRLKKSLEQRNRQKTKSDYQLSLSMGLIRYHPDQPSTVEELLELADASMYQDKRRKIAIRESEEESK